jgi:hypothetical protein
LIRRRLGTPAFGPAAATPKCRTRLIAIALTGAPLVDPSKAGLPLMNGAHEQVILPGTLERQRLNLRILRRISVHDWRVAIALKNCCCAGRETGARTAAASNCRSYLVERKPGGK